MDPSDAELWAAVRAAEGDLDAARRAFLDGATDRVAALRAALGQAAQRVTALRLLPSITVDERWRLFDELVWLCSVGHADVELCREAVRALPRDEVVARIERSAESLLATGGEEEYRRFLELYSELDTGLTARLADRALHHDDAGVQEAGAEYRGGVRS